MPTTGLWRSSALDELNAATNLEQLQAQAKALQAAIKQAKTNQPTVSKLDTVLAKQQADGGGKWLFVGLWKRLNARLAAGQPFDVAMHELLEQYRLLLSAPDAADRAKALETERVGTPAQTAHARQLGAARAKTE